MAVGLESGAGTGAEVGALQKNIEALLSSEMLNRLIHFVQSLSTGNTKLDLLITITLAALSFLAMLGILLFFSGKSSQFDFSSLVQDIESFRSKLQDMASSTGALSSGRKSEFEYIRQEFALIREELQLQRELIEEFKKKSYHINELSRHASEEKPRVPIADMDLDAILSGRTQRTSVGSSR